MNTKHQRHERQAAQESPPAAEHAKSDVMNASDVRKLKLECMRIAADTVAPCNDPAIVMRLAADMLAFVVAPEKPAEKT